MSGNEKNKKWFIVMAIVLVCFAYSPPQAVAGTGWLERQMLVASDGAAGDQFGNCVSISGDYAIVGANGDEGYKGAAYIFWWNGETWVEQQKLVALVSGDAGDQFGISVSISDDYAIVGAYGDDGYKGSAYIFWWNGDSWIEQQRIIDEDGLAWDRFGWSVSISDDYAIVGAFGASSSKGCAYIFKRDGDSWGPPQKITVGDGAAYDQFGNSVSINGYYAIVGANRNVSKGSAYIFKRDVDETWSQKDKLNALGGADWDGFGSSVSISGDYAIIGAPQRANAGIYSAGSAYIFKRDEGKETWSQQQELIPLIVDGNDNFGCSVSISNDYAIVGAYYDDDGGIINCGSAYIFRNISDTWSQQAKILALNGAYNDLFGYSVSISGENAIVGAINHHYALPPYYSGSAYIFVPCAGLTADLNGDNIVDVEDFSILADQWLQSAGVPSADIYPPGGDGFVDSLDLGVLVSQWLLSCP